jgi:hypothetical protein
MHEYHCIGDMLDVLFCSKHGLWSDSFHKKYLMGLSYLKGSSLYSCVVYGECFGISEG